MLIKIDKADLGDVRLSAEEGLAKIKEENAKADEQFHIQDQKVYENREAALGTPMQPSELFRRLLKLNAGIIIEQGGMPNAVAIRYMRPDPENPQGPKIKTYVTGCYVDNPLPEFSAVVVDQRGKPWREIRGWRSVLLALVTQNILTMQQVKLMFGNPTGQRGEQWYKLTQGKELKNG